MAGPAKSVRTGNPYVDGLIRGGQWDSGHITYGFTASSGDYLDSYAGGEAKAGFLPFSPFHQQQVRAILEQWSAVANLTFAEVAGPVADIRFGVTLRDTGAQGQQDDPPAWAYTLEGDTSAREAGDVWMTSLVHDRASPERGLYGYFTLLHEIGHALGLDHTHGGAVEMPLDKDSMEWSVMSYRSFAGAQFTYENETSSYAQSPMAYDIVAIQHLYGANYAHNSGNTVYRWDPDTGRGFVNGRAGHAPAGNVVFETVWDGGGTDTFDFRRYIESLDIDLRPGRASNLGDAQTPLLSYRDIDGPGGVQNGINARGSVYAAFDHGNGRALIENAYGGEGDDRIVGNTARNMLAGSDGKDRISGNEGNDTLKGGSGNDALAGGAGSDVLYGGSGRDAFRFGATDMGRRDVIMDFRKGQDRIDLRSLDANEHRKGDQAFKFIGTDAFHGKAGELRVSESGRSVWADTDGDGDADLSIALSLKGVVTLSRSDFLL